MAKKIKKSIWLNKYSIFFYISAVLVILLWFVFDWSKTARIISAILFLVASAFFNMKNKETSPNLFMRFVNWFSFTIMVVFTIIYIALSTGEVNLAIWLLLSAFAIFMIVSVIFNVLGLFKTKDLLGIIISYIIISFLIITFFGYLFTLVTPYKNSELIWTNSNTTVESAWDFVYFSSSIYYANSVGDIQPLNHSRTVMQIESAISFLFHIIILGFIVSDIGRKKSNSGS